MTPQSTDELQRKTIADFGEQWVRYSDNAGFYGSLELFKDAFGPLLLPEDIAGRRVADVGSGTGRIVHMLIQAGAAHVTAAITPTRDAVAAIHHQRGHSRIVKYTSSAAAAPRTTPSAAILQ